MNAIYFRPHSRARLLTSTWRPFDFNVLRHIWHLNVQLKLYSPKEKYKYFLTPVLFTTFLSTSVVFKCYIDMTWCVDE